MENYLPKWLVYSLGGLLVAFVALSVIQKGNDLETTFKNAKPANTISVSGEGKVTATPNLATVSIGVLSQGTTATDVKNQNDTKVNQVIAFIKQQGIDQKDIVTSQFSFYPQQDYTNGTAKITGYQGNQSVTVKVHNVDTKTDPLNAIIDGAVNNGANEIDGVNLSVEDPSALQEQAQEMAITDAKAKAQKLAQAAGLTLGKVVSISESNSGGYPGPVPYALNSAMGVGGAKSVAPDIQTGSQEIDESMAVVFEVK